MSKLLLILALMASLALAGTGCKTHEGSREYVPGKGWKPN